MANIRTPNIFIRTPARNLASRDYTLTHILAKDG